MELFKEKNKAIEWFKKERVMIFPTETVYGLGACATDAEGVRKIFEFKNRPAENPLIIHFCSIEQVKEYCHVSSLEEILLNTFTPGPLTILLKKKDPNIFPLATNNSIYICARLPQGQFVTELMRTFGPISAPSANLSGQLTLTREEMIKSAYKNFNIGAYIDDSVVMGVESTIIQVNNNMHMIILRKGLIDKKTLEKYGNVSYAVEKNENIIPGTRFLHYQTSKPLSICDHKTERSFHIDIGPNKACDFNLSKTGNIKEIYGNYFYSLYLGDQSSLPNITINTLPSGVEFDSLKDRLEKSLSKN